MAKSKEKKKLLPEGEEEMVENEEEERVENEEEEHKPVSKSKKKAKKKKKETIDVKIETVAEKKDKISPVIGYFPSGYDPLKKNIEPQASVNVYRHVAKSNRLQMVVRPHGTQVDFVGTSYTGEATAPQLCKYALGVLDKDTQTLRIVPIEANKIFRLETKIGGKDELANEQVEDPAEATAEKLNAMYSTKKKRREDAKRGIERVIREFDLKVQGDDVNKDALAAATSADHVMDRPHYDLSATSPEKAYPLEKIILKGEWDYLLDIFELPWAEVKPSVYPKFVCNRVHKLENVKDDSKKRKLAGIFSYINHLIKFKDKHSMDGVSTARNHKFPSILFQRFSSLFSVSSESRIPDDQTKLLISYVLVLTLFVDDFKSDPSDIAEDLRMTPVALRPHYEYLGCKFKRENKVLVATLPLPLEFQTIKRNKRKR